MNDGKRKRYRIADAEIEIAFTENYTEIICRDYEVKAEGKPDFVIEVTQEIIQTNIRKEQISPKTSSFRGFLYIPINLSDTTKTHEISTVTNT